MKPNNGFRPGSNVRDAEDSTRKAVKLPPVRKSGKERHELYGSLDDVDDDAAPGYRRRESVLDYFDDTDENAERDEEMFDDDPEDDPEGEYGEDADDDDWG